MTPNENTPTADRVYDDIDDPRKTGLADLMQPASPPASPSGEVVAWRVKDFADGWMLSNIEKMAMSYQGDGHLVEPLVRQSDLTALARDIASYVQANADLLDRVGRLEKALGAMPCPRPCNHRPDQFDAKDCIAAGECGCVAIVAVEALKEDENVRS